MIGIKEKSLSRCLEASGCRDLPKMFHENGVDFWIKAIARVKKRNGTESYCLVRHREDGVVCYERDFGDISPIYSLLSIHPYIFLDKERYMPLNDANKHALVMYILRTLHCDYSREELMLMDDAKLEQLKIKSAIQIQLADDVRFNLDGFFGDARTEDEYKPSEKVLEKPEAPKVPDASVEKTPEQPSVTKEQAVEEDAKKPESDSEAGKVESVSEDELSDVVTAREREIDDDDLTDVPEDEYSAPGDDVKPAKESEDMVDTITGEMDEFEDILSSVPCINANERAPIVYTKENIRSGAEATARNLRKAEDEGFAPKKTTTRTRKTASSKTTTKKTAKTTTKKATKSTTTRRRKASTSEE